MARILRGEIRWADLNPVRGREQASLRPVLILSQDIFNERSGTVIAVALTSRPQRAGFPLTFELQNVGAATRSWVKISQIRTLAGSCRNPRTGEIGWESDDAGRFNSHRPGFSIRLPIGRSCRGASIECTVTRAGCRLRRSGCSNPAWRLLYSVRRCFPVNSQGARLRL
jgi:mRNA interferase MazF